MTVQTTRTAQSYRTKEAQVLRYAQYLFLHTFVWGAYKNLCAEEEELHIMKLDIVKAQVLKLKMEAVLQVGKAPKPSRVEKLWSFMNQEVKVPPVLKIAMIGMVSLSIAAPITVSVTSHTEVTIMNPDILAPLR